MVVQMWRQHQLVGSIEMYTSMLTACAKIGPPALNDGIQIHSQVVKSDLQPDLQFHNILMNMYTKCGQPNTLSLWETMRTNDSFTASTVTYNCVLAACKDIGPPALAVGTHVHSLLREDELEQEYMMVTLLNMYMRCGEPLKSLELWKSFTASYNSHVKLPSALYTAILTACALVRTLEALEVGLAARSMMEGSLTPYDPMTTTAMIRMYLRCGDPNTALSLCSSQLLSYSLAENRGELDNIGVISALSVCSTLGNSAALQVGTKLTSIVHNSPRLRDDIEVLTALIGMYERCDNADKAILLWKDTISGHIRPTHLTYPYL